MQWTPELDKAITDLHAKRLGNAFIAKWLRLNPSHVRARLIELGLLKSRSAAAARAAAGTQTVAAASHDQASPGRAPLGWSGTAAPPPSDLLLWGWARACVTVARLGGNGEGVGPRLREAGSVARTRQGTATSPGTTASPGSFVPGSAPSTRRRQRQALSVSHVLFLLVGAGALDHGSDGAEQEPTGSKRPLQIQRQRGSHE